MRPPQRLRVGRPVRRGGGQLQLSPAALGRLLLGRGLLLLGPGRGGRGVGGRLRLVVASVLDQSAPAL
ncbi:hypothetical protein E1218_11670 [Kribbella turkmenica]|uniref:Uncharacterized protein n=1 Tax=Kribbella turkmenica TaxID=2530375 RepID=A0A4R4X910_9ACTN|nr:hypothetical protein [Kribbella turkmenica]TDD26986.1 hypothetical protein E1218_11670 [Kribbella turkmenica]